MKNPKKRRKGFAILFGVLSTVTMIAMLVLTILAAREDPAPIIMTASLFGGIFFFGLLSNIDHPEDHDYRM